MVVTMLWVFETPTVPLRHIPLSLAVYLELPILI